MSTVRTKTLVLGDSGTLANNLQWKVPGVPDGTLTLEREDGTDVLTVNAAGQIGIGAPANTSDSLTVGGRIVGRAAGVEGGELALNLPDNSIAGLTLDVGTPTLGRLFTSINNFGLQIGQVAGTGGTIDLYTQGSSRLYVSPIGRIGIGKQNPGTTLDVNGGIWAQIGNPAGANGYSFTADNDTGMFSPGDGQLEFWANNVRRVSIYDVGSTVKITKDNPTNYANSQLELQSNAGDVKFSLHAIGSSVTMFKHVRGGTGVLVRNSDDSAYEQISASAFNINSDYRLKENVQPMQDAIGRLMQLRPCTYTWKADGSYGEGFIAHQLQEIVPIAVTGEKDGMLNGEPNYQGVDAAKIVALLTAAMQEQQAIIQDLRMRVQLLEATK